MIFLACGVTRFAKIDSMDLNSPAARLRWAREHHKQLRDKQLVWVSIADLCHA